jgi:hypothetical protein
MADDKSYIIDPLTTLCKLALLHFMPEKTRVGIGHHVLHIQEYGYLQWMERKKNGDTRLDISNLIVPLIKSIRWYILDGNEKIIFDEDTAQSVRIIAGFAIKGFQKLQNGTYLGDDNINIVLQYFINMFRDALDGSWREENIVKINSTHNVLTDKIKNNLDLNTINFVAKTLSDAEQIKESTKDINILVDCVHRLLMNRDEEFVKLMKDTNTTL